MDTSSCFCGQNYVIEPRVIPCDGKMYCTIPLDANYFSSDRSNFCQSCFNALPGERASLSDKDAITSTSIAKSEFQELKNNARKHEHMVQCVDCGRTQHQICALHLDEIWPTGFVCDQCLEMKGFSREESMYTAKRLRTTILSDYLEARVDKFLEEKETGAGNVTIRVVSCRDKSVEVQARMKTRFVENGQFPAEFPYRAKVLLAFQEKDGVDVCFFGMHVQEYGSDSPSPNSRRVYLAYLDSVPFFEPKHFRTAVYYEILLGYLDYVKHLGYTMAHVCACPSFDEDYIFHAHPTEQKIPNPQRLHDWCKKLLDIGIIEGVVLDYKDIREQALEDCIQLPTELPYFDGDYWPIVIEETIEELDEEEEKLNQEEAILAMGAINLAEEGHLYSDCKEQKKPIARSNLENKCTNKKSAHYYKDMARKIFETMEKLNGVFFVVRLHSAQSAARLPPIQDPDPIIIHELMDGRDVFLTVASENHLEFSSLRRAKFSTLVMLEELHNEGRFDFVFPCNYCHLLTETSYHCRECGDIDLCSNCFHPEKHQHRMTELSRNSEEAFKQKIQRCIHFIVHSTKCRAQMNCHLPNCFKMFLFVEHSLICSENIGLCSTCNSIMAVCRSHARICKDQLCMTPHCYNFKQNIQYEEIKKRKHVKLRMQQMNAGMLGATGATSSATSVSKPVEKAAAPAYNQHKALEQTPTATGVQTTIPIVLGTDKETAMYHSMAESRLILPNRPDQLTGPSEGAEDWRRSTTNELRHHLSVKKIVYSIVPSCKVEAFLPSFEPLTEQDEKMKDAVSCAYKIEDNLFKIAGSQVEYICLLADKIEVIKKEYEEKRQQRRNSRCDGQPQGLDPALPYPDIVIGPGDL